jgi:hypothetical protein
MPAPSVAGIVALKLPAVYNSGEFPSFWKARTVLVTTPYFRATSKADLSEVPSSAIKVVGRSMYWSVSLAAIHTYLIEIDSLCGILRSLTKCQRSTPSAVLHSTAATILNYFNPYRVNDDSDGPAYPIERRPMMTGASR